MVVHYLHPECVCVCELDKREERCYNTHTSTITNSLVAVQKQQAILQHICYI